MQQRGLCTSFLRKCISRLKNIGSTARVGFNCTTSEVTHCQSPSRQLYHAKSRLPRIRMSICAVQERTLRSESERVEAEVVLLKPHPYQQRYPLVDGWYKEPAINIKKINMAEYLYFTDREQTKTL